MKVTPLDIRQKTFEKGFRGYEKEEVDAYLLTLSVEWEKLLEENRDTKNKISYLEKEVQKMREVESSLYKTLKTAEDTGSHLVDQANRTSELMLKEAQMNADAIMSEAKYSAKNIFEEAEAKAKNLEEEVKDVVRISTREIKEIENIKENLLIEIKSIANETIEKINKYASKAKSYQALEKIVEKPLFLTQQENEEKAILELKAKNGSFFDQL